MKHVFNGKERSQIAHLWMNKKQDHARDSRESFYFRGDTIYSYGSHFPIARHVRNSRGEDAVLMTTDTYSNTTAKHISMVRSALHGTVIHVPLSGSITPARVFEFYKDQIEESGVKAARARVVYRIERYTEDTQRWVNRARQYAEFFAEPMPEDLVALLAIVESPEADQLFKERVKLKAAAEREATRTHHQRQYEARRRNTQILHECFLAKLPEIIKTWRESGEWWVFDPNKGEQVKIRELPYEVRSHRVFPKGDLLRAGRDNDGKRRVITTRGSFVGVRCARLAFNRLRELWEADTPSHLLIDEVCGYKVTMMTTDFVTVGCHTIYRTEIEAFAQSQGWTK